MHVEHINAIMIAIKPSLFQFYFQAITKEMIKNYFKQIREQYKGLTRKRSLFIKDDDIHINRAEKLARL